MSYNPYTSRPLSVRQMNERERSLAIALAGGNLEWAAKLRYLPLFRVALDGRSIVVPGKQRDLYDD